MNNNYLIANKIGINVFLIVLVLALNACKKEYIEFPYNKIEDFSLTATDGSTMNASIVNQDIMVYWAPFQSIPDSIKPAIIISERATISPASGTKVPFKEGVTYTVTSQDGSVSTYTLKPIFNQPDFTAFTLSGSGLYNTTNIFRQTSTIVISTTDYFISDTSKTHVYLEATTGKTYQMPIITITSTTITSPVITADNFPALGTEFKVKVVTGIKSLTSAVSYTMAPLAPVITSTLFSGGSKKRGDSFTLTGVGEASYFTAASMATSISGTYYPLIIAAKNGNAITFTIPADYPLGTYTYFKYSYTGDTYHLAATDAVQSISTSSRRITITQ